VCEHYILNLLAQNNNNTTKQIECTTNKQQRQSRSQILQLHGLTQADFIDMQDMKLNVDKLIGDQNEDCPMWVHQHPPKIVAGFPMLDQFWYADGKGAWASI
jgi:hypothetical protein